VQTSRAAAEAYEALFVRPTTDDALEELRRAHRGRISRYRVKTIKAGPVLECEAYPIWDTAADRREARAARDSLKGTQAQRIVNERNARKHLARLLNANFGPDDLMITLTYKGRPPDLDTAQKDMRNYLRRIARYRKRQGLPELKYAYVIEHVDEDGRKKRVHHHLVMNGMDREAAEQLWGKGRANAARLQIDERGLAPLAAYMLKGAQRRKRWAHSRNLKAPTVTVATRKLPPSRIEQIARDLNEAARAVLEKAYRGYEYIEHEARASWYAPGAYIYAILHKKGGGKRE